MRIVGSLALLATVLISTASFAQEGNGFGNAYVTNTPARIGGELALEYGAPGLAHGIGLLSIASNFGPTFLPGIPYPLWIDAFDPNLVNIQVQLDAQGHGSVVFGGLPNDPALASLPPMYMYAVFVDPSLPPAALSLTFSKTVRLSFELPGTFRGTADLATGRGFHTATPTALDPRSNETGILVAGGAAGTLLAPSPLASTEIYRPLLRGFQSGPALSQARAAHQSVVLSSGHVLITGGLDAGLQATPTCEIFDPATDTLVPAATMHFPRAGHTATVLADGRVLVVGGLTTYANAAAFLPQVLSTTQTTAEIFDPANGTWTVTSGGLAAKRMGHAATLMDDGRVLISGGVLGATTVLFPQFGGPTTYPVMTAGCEVFDPATQYFTTTASLPEAKAFHTATNIPSVGVLAAGGASGASDGFTYTQQTCAVYAGGSWTATASLTAGTAFHSAVLRPEGDVLMMGGVSGNLTNGSARSATGVHNGSSFVEGPNIGFSPTTLGTATMAAHTTTLLYDGTYLVAGGWSTSFLGTASLVSGRVFVD